MYNSTPNRKKSEHYHNISTTTDIEYQKNISKCNQNTSTKLMNPTSNQTNVQLWLLNDNLSRKNKKLNSEQDNNKKITMNLTDISCQLSPGNGNSIFSYIFVFPHTESLQYPPT